MNAVEFALLYLGLAGLIVGLAFGAAVRRRRHRWVAVAIGGAAGAVLWGAFWVWWESQPCGDSCIRDATPALVALPFQLLAYAVGATLVLRFARR